jgi:O-antigen/teichoic acid export membrane protein
MTSERSFRNAVKWSYITQGTEQGLNALITFVFAAILGPKDFGLVAMAMAYILFAKMLLEQGLVPALVQRKDLKQEHLDSVFYLNLVLSLILVALSVGFSRWWAGLNHLPLLAPVISVLSLAIPLEGLTIVQRAVLSRDLDFKSFSIRSVIAISAGGVVGLGMAFSHFGVWSLVGKQLATDFVGLLALWRLGSWRPRLNFSLRSVKELTGFSSGAFVGNLGLFVNAQSDALLIGLFFGPVPVGLYRLAARLTNMIVTVATSSLQIASFPQFCRLQDKPAELRRSVLSCLRTAAIVTIPALAGLAVISRRVLMAIGPKWIDGTDALRILCVVAAVQPILYFVGPLLQAKSKPHYLAIIEWTHAAIGAGSLVVAGALLKHSSTSVQVTGMAATRFVTAVLLLTPIIIWLFNQFAQVTVGAMLKVMAPSLLAAGATSGTVLLISHSALLERLSIWPALIVEIAIGGLVASAMLLWLDKELRRMVADLVAKFRGSDATVRLSTPQLASRPEVPEVEVPEVVKD